MFSQTLKNILFLSEIFSSYAGPDILFPFSKYITISVPDLSRACTLQYWMTFPRKIWARVWLNEKTKNVKKAELLPWTIKTKESITRNLWEVKADAWEWNGKWTNYRMQWVKTNERSPGLLSALNGWWFYEKNSPPQLAFLTPCSLPLSWRDSV